MLDLCATPLLSQELSPPVGLAAYETDIEDRVETLRDLARIGLLREAEVLSLQPRYLRPRHEGNHRLHPLH